MNDPKDQTKRKRRFIYVEARDVAYVPDESPTVGFFHVFISADDEEDPYSVGPDALAASKPALSGVFLNDFAVALD